jgi:hypothetical protein
VNEQLLTKAYLDYISINMLTNVNKIYFGEKIPNIFIDNNILNSNPLYANSSSFNSTSTLKKDVCVNSNSNICSSN